MAEQKQSLRATNVELFSRDFSITDTDKKIHSRDTDNLYPLRIEKIINNSPTGRRCANLMAKFIAGNGVDGFDVVNRKGETLNDIIDQSSNDIAVQYGVYFHQYYQAEVIGGEVVFKASETFVLDYVNMARSQNDSDGFEGKFYLLKQEEKKSVFAKTDDKSVWFYPFNRDQKVILAQVQNDCKLKGITEPTIEDLVRNFRGQVLYLNMTPKYIYANPLADSVYNDLDTEYRISQYQNTQSRTGWLGKTVIKKFAEDENSNSDFDDALKENLGSEDSANVLVVNVPQGSTEDLNKAFVVEQLKAQYDDKLFESTIKNLRQNILGAFNNIPEPLIFSSDGALFGVNADTYTQMKKFYWEQNEYERFKLEKTLEILTGVKVSILPLKGLENG